MPTKWCGHYSPALERQGNRSRIRWKTLYIYTGNRLTYIKRNKGMHRCCIKATLVLMQMLYKSNIFAIITEQLRCYHNYDYAIIKRKKASASKQLAIKRKNAE